MSLPDILYIDKVRLDRYVEKIADPLKYDKVAEWKWKLTLLGPEVSGEQHRQGRPLTEHEKIELLGRYLLIEKDLGKGRFTDRTVFADNSKVFREETCTATKIHLPVVSPEAVVPKPRGSGEREMYDVPVWRRNQARSPEEMFAEHMREGERRSYEAELARVRSELSAFRGLNVWVSDRSDVSAGGPGSLFLIEDFPRADSESYSAMSAYSAMVVLFDELTSEFRKTVPFSKSGHELHNPESEFQKRFVADPVAALKGRGGHRLTTREITVLYRIRATVLYRVDDREAVATIAYPIVIMDAR